MAGDSNVVEIGSHRFEVAGNQLQGDVPTQTVVGKNQIEIDRQARHVSQEKIDCCSAFQGESASTEDGRRAASSSLTAAR
jgi:hypothetical protein